MAPNITLIAKDSSVDEISKLLRMVLFACVNSDKSKDYLEQINELNLDAGTCLLSAIDEV